MNHLSLIFGLCLLGLSHSPVEGFQKMSSPAHVVFSKDENKVDVKLDGDLFTSLDFTSYDKSILYPMFAPGQIRMTRDWPMKADTAGEGHDHPHHKSMWISHEINGMDFWTEKDGVVRTQSVETEFADGTNNAIVTKSNWVQRTDNKTLLTDETTYWFGGDQTSRWINCLFVFNASNGEIQFEDTKEGLFAIRTHPDLRLTADAAAGVDEVDGSAINSEGVSGKAVWGKESKWMLYFGTVDGNPVSIAMYDHPSNLRHPTTWHARDYGLIAANPFGLHYFQGQEKGAGAHKVGQGGSLELRYRVEFFNGVVSPEMIEQKFQSFAKEPLAKPTPITKKSETPHDSDQ